LGSESPEKAKVRFNFTYFKRKKIFLIIDETGDKRRERTDYVSRQYWEAGKDR